MTFASILALAIGVSLDATAVSAARGLAVKRLMPRHFLSVALWFGLAQGLMPLFGSLLGHVLGAWVMAWDHWVAFALLAGVGAHMLYEALGGDHEAARSDGDPFALRTMFVLALATSIDAFAVGVSLPILGAPVVLSCVAIALTTASLSALGLAAGRRFGALLGQKLDALGGVVLIGLGAKILLEHLAVF